MIINKTIVCITVFILTAENYESHDDVAIRGDRIKQTCFLTSWEQDLQASSSLQCLLFFIILFNHRFEPLLNCSFCLDIAHGPAAISITLDYCPNAHWLLQQGLHIKTCLSKSNKHEHEYNVVINKGHFHKHTGVVIVWLIKLLLRLKEKGVMIEMTWGQKLPVWQRNAVRKKL